MTKITFISSHDEVDNIRTFVFETGGASWKAGQFQQYDFDDTSGDENDWRHFFTIASAPSEHTIHISTRLSGSEYKHKLAALNPGDTIEAHDIEGDFTWEDDTSVVLVAAGIGVTPYRSMLLERAHQGKKLNAHILYFGRDDSFAFRETFDKLLHDHPELTIEYIVGEDVTADAIVTHAPESAHQPVYVSGPEAMVDTVGEELKSRGIELKQDWFPGYDSDTY